MNFNLSNISKKFRKTTVLSSLNLDIKPGEIVAILGKSGSGKSTLLNIIAGFEQSDSGEIIVNDKVLFSEENNIFMPPELRNIGYLFQNFALFPHMNVYNNIIFGVKKRGKNRNKIVQELLEMVGLSGHEKRYPHELSGGQQQRIALARALAPGPEVLLLDEPFSSLDAELRIHTRDEVRHILKGVNATTILVTHDQEDAFGIADQVAVMNQGIIEQIDVPDNIYHIPASRFVADFVGQAAFIEGIIEERGIATEIGVFPNNTSLAKGAAVELMIRPEDIHLLPDETSMVEVVSRCFKGSENLYFLKLSSGKLILSSTISTLIIKPGTKVRLDPVLTHIVVFMGDKMVSNVRVIPKTAA